MHFLKSSDKDIQNFCQAIIEAKQRIHHCSVCFNWVEGESLCAVCLSDRRLKTMICVVESWHDLSAIEKTGEYKGLYHVLGGVLCPLEGIGPESLRIQELLPRLSTEVGEVIFALNPTPEGEATTSYIQTKIVGYGGKVSKLARGVPVGSSLEFMDRITIGKALSDRKLF